jgi:hypothetical protein
MLVTTLDVIRAGLKSDPTITPTDRNHLIALLRTGVAAPNPPAPSPDTGPRIIRRREAARRLACCVRVIDRLAQEGKLKRVKLPGRVRAAGFREGDVNALLAG